MIAVMCCQLSIYQPIDIYELFSLSFMPLNLYVGDFTPNLHQNSKCMQERTKGKTVRKWELNTNTTTDTFLISYTVIPLQSVDCI